TRTLLGEHGQYLTLLATVDPRCRPALLPVLEPGVLRLDRLELLALERGALRMLDRALDRALAVRVADPARVGDDAVVREHRRVHGVELRLIEIRANDALLEVVEDNVCHGAAECPEGLFMKARPCLLVRLPDDLPEALAGVLQRHHEQVRAAVLAVRLQRQRAEPEVHLRLLAGQALEHVEALGLTHLQAPHEALDRVVAVLEPEPVDEVLVDRLSVAPELDLLLDPGAVRLAGGTRMPRRSRWPGWG